MKEDLFLAGSRGYRFAGDWIQSVPMGAFEEMFWVFKDPLDTWRDNEGFALAGLAAYFGRVDMIGWLHRHDVDLDAFDEHGRAPVHYAARAGNVNVFEALHLAGTDLARAAPDGVNAAHEAAGKGRLDALVYLNMAGVALDAKDSKWQTPAHWAATRGHVHILVYLVRHRVPMDAYDREYFTPAMRANASGQRAAFDFLLRNPGTRRGGVTAVAASLSPPRGAPPARPGDGLTLPPIDQRTHAPVRGGPSLG